MTRKCVFLLWAILAVCLLAACEKFEIDDTAKSIYTENENLSDIPIFDNIEITEPEHEAIKEYIAYSTEYLPYVTINEGYCITKCVEYSGTEYQYVIYELENSIGYTEYNREIYWTVIVLRDKQAFTVLRQDLDEYFGLIPTASDLVLETDVDFDGKNDILLWLGHFGNQGLIRYACYLSRDEGVVACPSFSDIANPAVDAENRVILSSWKNWAVSHSYAMYYFIDGEYVETERLTEEPVQAENDEELWGWTDEIFGDGHWQTREYFTEKDYDTETLYREKVYGAESHWDIAQDRWRTLFNNGMMSDFSIYSSEYIETE